MAKQVTIYYDLKNKQAPISNHEVPKVIMDAQTGIEVVDEAIKQLYTTGYMHNHMRMYVAAICCNVAQSHWLQPAKWMYSHLLDGDLASNHLSWQWVAGAFSNKKYVANQDNINHFFQSTQKDTFLDMEYHEFEQLHIPNELKETCSFDLKTVLPETQPLTLHPTKTTLVYNYYNIDPYWHQEAAVQRVFIMEPSFFKDHPVSQQYLNFAIDLTHNIEGIQLFTGEFSELAQHLHPENIIYKEHPTNTHYQGQPEPREWLSSVTGYYPSFFAFWKKCKKEL